MPKTPKAPDTDLAELFAVVELDWVGAGEAAELEAPRTLAHLLLMSSYVDFIAGHEGSFAQMLSREGKLLN